MADLDPSEYDEAGAQLVRRVQEDYELSGAELALLDTAARLLDRREQLRAQVGRDGLMSMSSQGVRVHPAAQEERQVSIALTRTLTAIKVPDDGTP